MFARPLSVLSVLTVALPAVAALAAGPAPVTGLDAAVGNPARLRVSDTTLRVPRVPQTGHEADRIRAILKHITLPPGFRIGLFAVAPDARSLAVAPNGTVFIGTRQTRVWAATGRTGQDAAAQVRAFAPDVRMTLPNGVCLGPRGTLYVAELNRVLAYPKAAAAAVAVRPDPVSRVVVPQGKLIPAKEESFVHGARVCAVGPDHKLYIALGQPYNVTPPAKVALYRRLGMGGIIRMNRDGSHRQVVATGIRNSVGLAFDPATGRLWFTDNQVDRMGDDIPPGEINRLTAVGQNFGFPWYGGGHIRTDRYKNATPPPGVVFPVVETTAHAADLGLMFYTGSQFPAAYRGGIFTAQHGSWNRSTPVGARIIFTPIKADGTVGKTTVFASGWLDQATGGYRGRPVDVKPLPDGSILVSDDKAGAVYRIWYAGE